jgi:hypothetical protein
VKPRIVKSLGARDGVKTPWIFEKSAFRTYKQDTFAILEKCFEADYPRILTKLEYLIKDE